MKTKRRDKMEETKCNKCGCKNYNANFCERCGNKLKEVCNCWIKKEPYNCGEKKCPSYRLYKKIIVGK